MSPNEGTLQKRLIKPNKRAFGTVCNLVTMFRALLRNAARTARTASASGAAGPTPDHAPSSPHIYTLKSSMPFTSISDTNYDMLLLHTGAAYAAGRSYATLFQKLGSNPEAVGFAAASVAAFSLGGVAFASSPLERSFIMIKPDGVHR